MGDRIRGFRELIGHTRKDFAEIIGVDPQRLRNVENGSAKANEDYIEAITVLFPEFVHWIAYEGEIDFKALQESQTALVRLAAARIEAGLIPEGYFLEENIKKRGE
jgi:transcriptional regulator with XRE-family HTH domain